ncbi:MAG: hypothetical protein L0Y72_09810 [Gemmataceae bacterium]|nr:hypothetical protein [Gemmataceae bacterium]MCI0739327.1 hypothetical protein [Gemmataceae bacterium]
MAASKKPNPNENELRDLKKENAFLKKQLKAAESERDAFRRAVHALAKEQITAEKLREWDKEDEDSGKTILDIVAEVKRKRSKAMP